MYVDRGGSPQDFDEMSWGTVEDWLTIHDIMEVRQSLGGIPEN